MRRYLVDDRELDGDAALALHRSVLAWAAGGSDRFVLGVDREAYDDGEPQLRSLLALPDAASPSPGTSRFLRMEGPVSTELVGALTGSAAPRGATAGDLSPSEDVELRSGGRTLFASYDYGRTQVLTLTDAERVDLERVLAEEGFSPAVLLPAPPYVAGEQGSTPHT